jgi:hypothetical protein
MALNRVAWWTALVLETVNLRFIFNIVGDIIQFIKWWSFSGTTHYTQVGYKYCEWWNKFIVKKVKTVNKSHKSLWRRKGERKYSSYSLTTLALDGGEWSASCHGRALPPGKGPPVPIVQEAG